MYIIRTTEEDKAYIERGIRKDFDSLDIKETTAMFEMDELIKRAERLGFADLAKEMKSDYETEMSLLKSNK